MKAPLKPLESPLTSFTVTPTNPRPPQGAGEVLRVSLEQTILDHTGRDDKGPHPVGKAEILSDGRLRIAIIDTAAGRHAAAMLRDDMIDVVHSKGSVRLRVSDE